jgi:hypothetical protein
VGASGVTATPVLLLAFDVNGSWSASRNQQKKRVGDKKRTEALKKTQNTTQDETEISISLKRILLSLTRTSMLSIYGNHEFIVRSLVVGTEPDPI